MTYEKACELASRDAKQGNTELYIVWSNEEEDAPGEHYHYGPDHVIDTFFYGCRVVAHVSPTEGVTR